MKPIENNTVRSIKSDSKGYAIHYQLYFIVVKSIKKRYNWYENEYLPGKTVRSMDTGSRGFAVHKYSPESLSLTEPRNQTPKYLSLSKIFI